MEGEEGGLDGEPQIETAPLPQSAPIPPLGSRSSAPICPALREDSAGLCPGGLAEGPVPGTGRAGASRPGQVRFLQTHKFRPSRNGTIIYSVALVVHVWVRVKYGPALFTGGDVNCAALVEDRRAFGGCRLW